MTAKKHQVDFAIPKDAETATATAIATATATPEGEQERRQWRGKLEFILTIVGFAVGLGNVWRFPYLCFSNGGGAFIIPYVLMLLVLGLPVFFLELSIGQYASLGCIALFDRLSPLFKGLGWGMSMVNCYILTYYTVVVAWAIHYLYSTLASIPSGVLPWSYCDKAWASDNCVNITTTNATSQNVSLYDFPTKRIMQIEQLPLRIISTAMFWLCQRA